MLFCCLKCQKNTKNINPVVSRTSNGKIMVLSRCDICGCKKSKFIKELEASGILSSLGLKLPLSNINNINNSNINIAIR